MADQRSSKKEKLLLLCLVMLDDEEYKYVEGKLLNVSGKKVNF